MELKFDEKGLILGKKVIMPMPETVAGIAKSRMDRAMEK